jgi:hypothetical protein
VKGNCQHPDGGSQAHGKLTNRQKSDCRLPKGTPQTKRKLTDREKSDTQLPNTDNTYRKLPYSDESAGNRELPCDRVAPPRDVDKWHPEYALVR